MGDTVFLLGSIIVTLCSVIVFLVTFWIRSLSLFPGIYFHSQDMPFHVNAVFDMWKNGNRHIMSFDRLLISPELGYPFLFHRLIAWIFNPKSFERLAHYVNPFLESLFNVVLFLITYFSFKGLGGTLFSSLLDAGKVSLLYIFAIPMFISTLVRLSHFGERGFAVITGSIALLAVIYGVYLQSYWFFFIAVLFNIVVFQSSQFGAQAIVLINIVYSFLIWDARPFLSLLASVLAMFIFLPRYFTRFVYFKYLHLVKFYFPTIKNNKRSMAWVYDSFFKKILLKAPYFYVGLAASLFLVYRGNINPFIYLNMMMWNTSVIVCMIVYIPVFRCIGEAHRYLEFAMYSFLIITVTASNLLGNEYYWTVLLVFTVFHMLNNSYLDQLNKQYRDENRYVNDLIAFLNCFQDKVILSIPNHVFTFYMMRLTSHRFVDGIYAKNVDKYYDVFETYQVPRADLDYIYNIYKFDFVVVDRKWLACSTKKYNFSWMRPVFANKHFQVFTTDNGDE